MGEKRGYKPSRTAAAAAAAATADTFKEITQRMGNLCVCVCYALLAQTNECYCHGPWWWWRWWERIEWTPTGSLQDVKADQWFSFLPFIPYT